MKAKKFDAFIIGFAIFAIFFGAGNLIFPPTIGLLSGSEWFEGILGLMISAVVLPIATILAVDNLGGDLEHLCSPISKWFSTAFSVAFIIFLLVAGPPRQAGVAIETGVYGMFPALSENNTVRIVLLFVYLALATYLALNPAKVVDVVGKYLTPFLMVVLVILTVLAFVNPIGTPAESQVEHAFFNGFITGYQTGDVVVGVALVSTFIISIKDKGYTEKKSRRSMILKAGLVAVCCFAIIYTGLTYLGAAGSSVFPNDMDQTALLNAVVNAVAGRPGMFALGLGIFIACLTTSIGVLSLIARIVVSLSGNKFNYKLTLVIVAIICYVMSVIGVSNIIRFSSPLFYLLYPASIVMTLLGIFFKFVPNHGVWKGGILAAVLFGLYDAVAALNGNGVTDIHIDAIEKLYSAMPLAAHGMAWLVPSIACAVIGGIVVALAKGKAYPMLAE